MLNTKAEGKQKLSVAGKRTNPINKHLISRLGTTFQIADFKILERSARGQAPDQTELPKRAKKDPVNKDIAR